MDGFRERAAIIASRGVTDACYQDWPAEVSLGQRARPGDARISSSAMKWSADVLRRGSWKAYTCARRRRRSSASGRSSREAAHKRKEESADAGRRRVKCFFAPTFPNRALLARSSTGTRAYSECRRGRVATCAKSDATTYFRHRIPDPEKLHTRLPFVDGHARM